MGAIGCAATASDRVEAMRHRIPLPDALGTHFSVRQAAAVGIRRGRADAGDLARPFHGVRSQSLPLTFRACVDAYASRMTPEQRLVGRSALRLWALPVPDDWAPGEALDVAVPGHLSPPRLAGVKGRRLAQTRAATWKVGGVNVVDPVAAAFTAAKDLTVVQMVVLLDAIVTVAQNYPGRKETARVPATVQEVEHRLAVWGRFPGSGTVRAALAAVRERVESPKETETRLAIVADGLAEPQVQHEVWDGFRLIARTDLAYPDLKIAIEYEGDGHRTDKEQWRIDIARQRELEGQGWLVIRLTQADLDRPAAFLARIRAAIITRSA